MKLRKLIAVVVMLIASGWAQVIDANTLGIDCSGKIDNAPQWQRIVNAAGEDASFSLPTGCVDMHTSTVTVSSRADFKLMSTDRVQNGGGNRRPIELWTGTTGGMWDFQANQAPTIEGFLFSNTTNLDYYLRFDGDPGARIGTEALIRYNTFTNNTNDPKFSAVLINVVSGQNHEKNVITDNDFFCSQSKAFRESDSGQTTSGNKTLTCGLGNCAFMTDANVGDRIRVSYATGILDTTVQSITDNNHLVMAAVATSNQTGARVHFRQAHGNGITIGSVNSKHNTIDRNSFTQCSCGLNVVNGSFSASMLTGSADDTLACIGNVSEGSKLDYLASENSLRDLYVGNMDAPLEISHARNSIYNAESDGFIYFARSARVTMNGSTIQSTPVANSVLIRAANPSTVVLLSFGNLWGPGAVDKKSLGFSQWDGITGPQGALISCGDFGMTDQDGNWTSPITCGAWTH